VRWRPVAPLSLRGSYQKAVRALNIGELFSPQTGQQVAIGTPPVSIGDPCDVRSTARTGPNAAQVRALCLAQGIPGAAIDSYQFPTTATAGVISGNIGLVPETAHTYNFGFILNRKFASPWLHDFTLSIDYYNVSIKDVISTVPGLTTLSDATISTAPIRPIRQRTVFASCSGAMRRAIFRRSVSPSSIWEG